MITEYTLEVGDEERRGQRAARARKRVADRYRDTARKARRYRGKMGRSDGSLPPWLREDHISQLREQLWEIDTAHHRGRSTDRVYAQNAKALKPVPWTHLTPGSIVDAWVPYQDGTGSKRRPMVVSRVVDGEVHGHPVTTSLRRFSRLDKLIEIAHWENAGLQRPCGIMGREVKVPRTEILGRLGVLEGADATQFEAWLRHADGVAAARRVAEGLMKAHAPAA